jgi:chemotaxis protein methyltransferase CheR
MTSLFASIKAALRGDGPEAGGIPTAGAGPEHGAGTGSQPAPVPATHGPSSVAAHSPSSVEEIELELLLEAVFQCYGYDFRGYDRGVLARKVEAAMTQLSADTISALQAKVLHDTVAWNTLLRALYVEPALMFDDAGEVALLRTALAACLRGVALPRLWLADCAGAQQAWTLAILLEQEQLGAHTEIYATVASDALLAEARQASLPMARLTELQGNYVRSGGVGRLLDYFEVNAEGTHAVLLPRLRDRITWAQYNLVTDASFNEFQMILAHRALPDFGPALRRRVLKLFDDSLAPFGLLALDRPLEQGDAIASHYKPLFPHHSWYKRVG